MRTLTATGLAAQLRGLDWCTCAAVRWAWTGARTGSWTEAPLAYPSQGYPTTHAAANSAAEGVVDTPWFLDGRSVASLASHHIDVHDPATGGLVTRVPELTDSELGAAVASAQRAFPSWRDSSVLARQQHMFRFAALIRSSIDRLAAVITLEQGKTLADARGDVVRGLQVVEAACAAPELLKGELLEVAAGMDTRTYREPLGVVAAICPFNFPAMIPLWSIPVATVTGNTIVVKPSERDPGAAMILAELATEAGFPAGVVNVVHGTHRAVDFLLDHDAVRAISFVGSNRVGNYIYARGSAKGKRVQANLGAKNHAAVLPDCDREHMFRSVIGAAFGAAGQRCMALSTLVTVGSARGLLRDLAERASKLQIGGGFVPGVDFGPVISAQSLQRIEELIGSAEAEGATVLLDGRGDLPDGDAFTGGHWMGPTVIAGVRPHMRCYREEVFGPVLVCLEVDTEEEAIELINANEYGNGATVFTRSGGAAARFRAGIEAGQVGINVPIPVPLPMFSFSGNKGSVGGGGANTFYGRPGIAFYTQCKTVTETWPGADEPTGGTAHVAMPTL